MSELEKEIVDSAEVKESKNFIEQEIDKDLAEGVYTEVCTRFPPEPNGYLHIGHAKSILLNSGLAKEYGGTFHLRFDDTNPMKEDMEFVESIKEDVQWLGADYKDHLYFASNYFDTMYECAVKLIKKGKAYVCDLSADEIREYRGTLTESGKDSPYRDRSVEENLELFERMKNGEFEDGTKVLRAKIDMASPNINMRDPVIYRVAHMTHHNTGDKWCIYPMYDFAHPIEDAVEHITHSICTLEFEDHRPLYDWVVKECEFDPAPRQIEFSKLYLTNVVTGKRYIKKLVMDGIVAGVGAVLGFVPQILILFIFLAFLEGCGYMARIAFIMDRIFRKFGLSGKSFIPMLIGSGCGVPGIMASRTIENDRDRKMTIMTTTFIPCGAKLPFIAMVAGAIFGGASWVAPSAYFLGIAAIICSGIILKKTKLFAGDPAPFVMELPAYHMPTVSSVLRSMWERGWSFIKKAGTIILLSTIVIWFTTYFGFVDGAFQMLEEDQIDSSILATIGKAISWIFIPQGFGNWQATVASVTGLVAKENIVGTMGILYGGQEGVSVYAAMAASFTAVSGYAFLAFNLLCAPCFAAMGAIKREMNNTKWFWIAIGYQCGFAYLVALVINQIGSLFTGAGFGVGTVVAFVIIVAFIYLLFRPYKESKTLSVAAVK